MSRYHNDMDVGVDEDGEVFVTKNASTFSRRHRQQQFSPADSQNNTAGNTQLRRLTPSSLFSVSLERVHGLTLTSNAAFTCFAEENLIAYTAGFVIVIYNLRDDKQFFITNHTKKAFTCVAFSNDGRFLATGEAGASACVRIWSVRDRSQLVELKGGHKQSICCVAFSPRNTKFVVSTGGQHDNYIRVWQWRSALAATLAPSYRTKEVGAGDNNSLLNSPAGGSASSGYLSALVASNKLSSPITSLAVLTLPQISSSGTGDTASSTGHSTNDDPLTAADDDDGASDDENENMESTGSSTTSKRTNIIIVTAGMHHLKYWYLDAALQGKGSQHHAMRRDAKARQSTTSSKSTSNSNILPGKSIKLDEIEFFNSSSLFTFADVAIPSLQPHYVICCTRSPTAALLQFHTGSRRLEKWVELKAAHAYCLAIAPYPFTTVQSDNAADTDAAVGIASAQRHSNFDHYQKYEVVFVGCSQGIIRVFDCDTLNVVISSLPRPHWLGISAHEANQKGRPPQPPVLGGVTAPDTDGVLLPASIVYPDCIALRYDAQHQHLAAVYSDHSLYIWDVRRLLSEKRIGKLTNFLAHSRCIWGLDSTIMPSISSDQQQQGSGDNTSATLLASSSSDNTVRLWRIPSVTGNGDSSEQQQQYQRSNSKSRQSKAVTDNSARFELESIIYNTNTVASSPVDDEELMDVDANASTLSIDYLNDAAFDSNDGANTVDSSKDANQGCRCVRISDDCRLLAAGYRDGNIRVFEIKFNNSESQTAAAPMMLGEQPTQNISCNPLCRIEAHESEVLCLQFSTPFANSDNSSSTATTLMRSQNYRQGTPHLLASGSRDRLIHIFNVRSDFAYVATIDCHSSSITSLQFYFTTYAQTVQLQGGVKGGLLMQRRLYAAAKRNRHHRLLMLATCGLDKQVMFTHVDIHDDKNVEAVDDDEHRFEQIDAITTPCAMYDMRLVKRSDKSSSNAADESDSFSVRQPPAVRSRRLTPAEPYDSSSNSSSPVVPAAGRLAAHSRMQQQYDRMAAGESNQENDMTGQDASAGLVELYTANQDQYVRVFDAVARKWVRSFHIDTGSGAAAGKSTDAARKNVPAAAAAPAAVIKLDIANAPQNSSSGQQQPQLLMAASCSDKTLVLYDAVSGELACTSPFYGHSELVTSLKLIDDGRQLVSAAGDSTLFVWRITPLTSAMTGGSSDQRTSLTVARRRRAAAGSLANNNPTHSYSTQNLSGVQPKLMMTPSSGQKNWDARNAAGLPPAPVRGARIVRAGGGMPQQQQRRRSDESDDDDGPQTSGSVYSSRSTGQANIAPGANTAAATQQRRRSAAARAGGGAYTLHHPHHRMSSQERPLAGGGDDQRGTPSWAPRRRMAQSVERPSGVGNQQQFRAANQQVRSNYDNGREYGDEDDDEDRVTNAAIGAEGRARATATGASQNMLLNNNSIATMQRTANDRRRNVTGNDELQQQLSPRRMGVEPRVPSPNQAALSLQDTLLMLSGRANGGGGLPPRPTPSATAANREQQQVNNNGTPSGNVMYYSVNSDTIRRGTTQQRQRSGGADAAGGTASVMSTPTSTSTTTSQSSAALRALQATAERRAAAAATAAGRLSPQSPVNSMPMSTLPQPAPQPSSVRAAMEAATASTKQRRSAQELLTPMNALNINRNDAEVGEQHEGAQNIPQPPPRRNISGTGLSSATAYTSAADTSISFSEQQQSSTAAAGNDDDAVIESLVGGSNMERGGKQRLSLTRRHMKAAKDRLAAKQQQVTSLTSGVSVAEEEPVLNEQDAQKQQPEENTYRQLAGNDYNEKNNNVSWVAARRAQLNAQSTTDNARQQPQQYSNVRSMFAGELAGRNANNKQFQSSGAAVPSRFSGGGRNNDAVGGVGGGIGSSERSLGAESPPPSTTGSPHQSLSGGEDEEQVRPFRY